MTLLPGSILHLWSKTNIWSDHCDPNNEYYRVQLMLLICWDCPWAVIKSPITWQLGCYFNAQHIVCVSVLVFCLKCCKAVDSHWQCIYESLLLNSRPWTRTSGRESRNNGAVHCQLQGCKQQVGKNAKWHMMCLDVYAQCLLLWTMRRSTRN